MQKKCVNCINLFDTTIKTRNKKYCETCKLIIWKKQKKEYDQRKSLKRKINHKGIYCVLCSLLLPLYSHIDRKYCDNCLVIMQKKRRRTYYLNSKITPKLLIISNNKPNIE